MNKYDRGLGHAISIKHGGAADGHKQFRVNRASFTAQERGRARQRGTPSLEIAPVLPTTTEIMIDKARITDGLVRLGQVLAIRGATLQDAPRRIKDDAIRILVRRIIDVGPQVKAKGKTLNDLVGIRVTEVRHGSQRNESLEPLFEEEDK
jgi:hypothetical protein